MLANIELVKQSILGKYDSKYWAGKAIDIGQIRYWASKATYIGQERRQILGR